MSLHTSAVSAAHTAVLALVPGDVDPLVTDGMPSSEFGVWLNDGDDAVWLNADDPAVILAALDRARAAVLTRFTTLAPAGVPTPDPARASLVTQLDVVNAVRTLLQASHAANADTILGMHESVTDAWNAMHDAATALTAAIAEHDAEKDRPEVPAHEYGTWLLAQQNID